jgi:hypothetical protein
VIDQFEASRSGSPDAEEPVEHHPPVRAQTLRNIPDRGIIVVIRLQKRRSESHFPIFLLNLSLLHNTGFKVPILLGNSME